jgi:uncharacterized protein (TIGR02145 family)
MKSTSGWYNNGNGSNLSGFTGLPGGYRYSSDFGSSGHDGSWWSASESGSYSWLRTLYYYSDFALHSLNSRSDGFSARCLQGSDTAEIPGCIDDTACNYDSTANQDDGSCQVFDNCGVCGGDGSTCGGGITCPDLVSHDNYDYSIVLIGDQCWFSENCRYLPTVSPTATSSTTSPYYYVYGYQGTDVAAAQATTNYDTYGVLYNWPAVMTEGICPSGWHIPSDGEWQTMEVSLGMSEAEAASTGWRGSPVGDYLKSTSGWDDGGNGSNSSGFTGLPGGFCYSGGIDSSGSLGFWWSSSESNSYSWERELYRYGDGNVNRTNYNRSYGFSARCVRD